jgi:hypothetical protein
MPEKTESTKEYTRLQEASIDGIRPWDVWGPYLSERAWGTVREDYSPAGEAWDYFPFSDSHKRTYRWNEDGIGGISDRFQSLCLSFAFWNGKDPILKERLFGLQPSEGNHGEDVKEYYYYLDATPTHSYMEYLYKYPQARYPYEELIEKNKSRSKQDLEYELLDTGVFDQNRYFDIFIRYAKVNHMETCVTIEAHNRGDQAAPLHILPHVWYRNTWCWSLPRGNTPEISVHSNSEDHIALLCDDHKKESITGITIDYSLGDYFFYAPPGGTPLFTNNESNCESIWDSPSSTPYTKDAFHREIIQGDSSVNPKQTGTKACIHYSYDSVPPGSSVSLAFYLSNEPRSTPLKKVGETVQLRKKEADEYYDSIYAAKASEEEKRIQRQSLASMIWSKQFYHFRVNQWLKGDPAFPQPPSSRAEIRNKNWKHINTMRIMSMPDKWEYPWFAAWDLAFHTLPLGLVDIQFAKEQLWYLLFEQFFHPSGQIPAYEWEFSDLNPPVHAWAVWEIYLMEKKRHGKGDREFLEKCFHKLILNFSWWVNRVDQEGHNVFEGGFLGLDNITIFDRSTPLPDGISLQQSDGTGWMGFFSLSLMRIALELAIENTVYEGLATKFFQHYVYIGAAIKKSDNKDYELWSEKDGFFYDVLCYPNGSYDKFRVRSLVGIIPLFATEIFEQSFIDQYPEYKQSFDWFITNRKDLVKECVYEQKNADKNYYVFSLMSLPQLRRVLEYVWNPSEFRSEYGLRSLSKYHLQHPFTHGDAKVGYEPGESTCWIKGGNSNWRGPIWFPTNYLTIHSLLKLDKAFGLESILNNKNECVSIRLIAQYLAQGLIKLFLPDADGRRPAFGEHDMFKDEHWKDYLLFYEHFHGCNGRGLGASHQTGWTGLIANIIDEWRS